MQITAELIAKYVEKQDERVDIICQEFNIQPRGLDRLFPILSDIECSTLMLGVTVGLEIMRDYGDKIKEKSPLPTHPPILPPTPPPDIIETLHQSKENYDSLEEHITALGWDYDLLLEQYRNAEQFRVLMLDYILQGQSNCFLRMVTAIGILLAERRTNEAGTIN